MYRTMIGQATKPPAGLAGIKATFGDFKYMPLSGGNIDVEDTWEVNNLVLLRNVNGTGLNIRLHRLVADSFQTCLSKALKACPSYKVRMLGGYCPRLMKSINPRPGVQLPLSVHSWGAAFDVNWDKNGFSKRLITDLPLDFVSAFRAGGWQWGGDWRSSKDAMHFQFCTGY